MKDCAETKKTKGYRTKLTDWLPGGFRRYMARTLPEAIEREEMYGCFPDPVNFQTKRIIRGIDLANYNLILYSGALIGLAKGLTKLLS